MRLIKPGTMYRATKTRVKVRRLPALPKLSSADLFQRIRQLGFDPFRWIIELHQVKIHDLPSPDVFQSPMRVHAQMKPSDAIAFRDQDKH